MLPCLCTTYVYEMLTVEPGSLCPDDFEEAMALIPSLQGKIEEKELTDLLNEMKDLRKFAT